MRTLIMVLMLLAGSVSAESADVGIGSAEFFPNEYIQPVSWPPAVSVGPATDGELPCKPGPESQHQDRKNWVLGRKACSLIVPREGDGRTVVTDVMHIVAAEDKTVTIEWAYERKYCHPADGEFLGDDCVRKTALWDGHYAANAIAEAIMRESFGLEMPHHQSDQSSPPIETVSVTDDFRELSLTLESDPPKEVVLYLEVIADMSSTSDFVPAFPDGRVVEVQAPLYLLRRFDSRGSSGFRLRVYACPGLPFASLQDIDYGFQKQFCRPPIDVRLDYDPAQPFSDVPSGHPNADAIRALHLAGIVRGYEDGSFRPDATINRAEFLKMVLQTPSRDTSVPVSLFSDTPADAWYSPYVLAARQKSVIGGYPDGTFKPGNEISFAEAAKIIVLLRNPDTAEASSASSGPWYEQFVLFLSEAGAIPTSVASLDQRVTRGEIAEIMYRLGKGVRDKPSAPIDRFLTGGVRTFCSGTFGFCFDHDASVLVKPGTFPTEFLRNLGGAIPNPDSMARTIVLDKKDVEMGDVDEFIGGRSMGYEVSITVLEYTPEAYGAIQSTLAKDLLCREDGTRCQLCDIQSSGTQEIAGQTIETYSNISRTERCDAQNACVESCEDVLARATAVYVGGNILVIRTVGTQGLYDVYDKVLSTLRAE